MTDIVPLSTVSADLVDALLDRAFGADRHARTAYRVRGTVDAFAQLSFAAMDAGHLVGSVQCWPIVFRADAGLVTPLVMLGPVAVEPARHHGGIGRALINRALEAAAAERLDGAVMLIGDPEYYGRFFGFDAARTAGWRLPGPVERHRVLARGTAVPDGTGDLGPADRGLGPDG